MSGQHRAGRSEPSWRSLIATTLIDPYEDDAPPAEPEPSYPPEPAGWSLWDFTAFLARRHPEAAPGWCGCGVESRSCAVRYGLSMIDWRSEHGFR